MNEVYCSHCGKSFPGSATPSECPDCHHPLAPPVPSLDVASIVRRALDDQHAGEQFDLALRRVTDANNSQDKEKIHKAISGFIKMQSWRQSIPEQEAARQLADAETELKIMPDGTPFLETKILNLQGLESLSQEQRDDVMRQIKESMARGTSGPIMLRTDPSATPPWVILIVFAAIVCGMIVAYLLSR